MQNFHRNLVAVLFLCLSGAGVMTARAADPVIEAAKASGIVGERVDGYLGLVDVEKVDTQLRRHVAEINARRRDVYTRMSRQTGESLSSIAALTAARQIENAAAGEYVMTADGRWLRK